MGEGVRHGGKRPNAGRPTKDTKQLNIRISTKAIDVVNRAALDQKKTKAKIIEQLILDLIN